MRLNTVHTLASQITNTRGKAKTEQMGQAKDLIGLLEDDGRFRIVCLIDETEATQVLGHEVVRPEDFDGGCRDALLAIGLPDGKVSVLAQYERFEFRWQSYVDRRACVSPHAQLGNGCIIAPFAVLSGDVRLGAHVYVAAFAGAGHDSTIGDLCSLLPYSGLGGGSRIGARCTLGAGAHLLPGITIGNDVMVAGGATVTRDLPDRVTAFGTPARTMARV